MDISKLNKDDIATKCVGYLRDYSSDMSTLQTARENALKSYMSQPYGNEVAGRSQVVMSDVFNTIESLMPSLMRIFAGSADVAQVAGQGPEDDKKAKLMAELLNYQSRKCFNSFIVFHDWFKDALMFRLGVVKYYWLKETKYKAREYKGLSQEEYGALSAREDFEIQKEETDGITYTVKGRDIITTSKPMVEVLPSEEFIFDVRAKSLKDSFCAHKKKVHRDSLSKYGVKDSDIADTIAEMSGENIENERFRDLGGKNFLVDEDDKNFVYIYECYYNEYEKGEPIPVKAVVMGNRVIDLEENKYGKPPFRDIAAVRLTHRVVGRSYADLVEEVQKLKTALVRYILDNIYYQNNAQRVVNPYKINLDDIFDQNVPGGVVRTLDINVPVGDVVAAMPTLPLPPQVFGFLEYADGSILENRTGVTRYNQGLDSDSLNKTASGISQIMSAAQQRIELIARLFAETGVKGLYEDIAQMNLDFFDKPTAIKINEKWQTINPQDIDGQYDINIDVGIGTGTKEMIVQQLMSMLQLYMNGLVEMKIATPENVAEMVKAVWENMGFKNADKFIQSGKDENGEPQGQPAVDPMQQIQLELQRTMSELEIERKQKENAKIESDTILNLAKAEAAEAGQQLAEYKAVADSMIQAFQQGQSQAEMPQEMQIEGEMPPEGMM
jgi:hypothetical protein